MAGPFLVTMPIAETAKKRRLFCTRRRNWPASRYNPRVSSVHSHLAKVPPRPLSKPISVGLTCWLWERRARMIRQLALSMGVTLQLTQHIHGLRLEIECQVSGENVERFIGEFARRC